MSFVAALGMLLVAQPPLSSQQPSVRNDDVAKAEEAFKQGKVDEALRLLQEASKKTPTLPPPRLTMAKLFLAANQGPNARIQMEIGLAEAPDNPELYLFNASVALAEGRITDCILSLQAALQFAAAERWTADQRKTVQREARAGLAAAFERRGDFAAARGQLTAWLELDPNNAAARQRLARVLFLQGKVDEALAELTTAAKGDPAADPPELGMARLYAQRNDIKAGDDKSADDWFQKSVAKYPNSARVHQEYGNWLLERGRLDAAKPHAEAATQLDPKGRPTAILRGLLARWSKDYPTAEKVFEEMLREAPADPWPANQLALVLIEQNEPRQQQRALQLAELNARQNPRAAEAVATLGWVYFRTGKVEEADRELGKLSPPFTPDIAYFAARVLKERGKPDDARRIIEMALASPVGFTYRAEAQKFLTELPPAPPKPPG